MDNTAAAKINRDSRRGQSKRDISGLCQLLGSLSKDVFERRTSTGSEAFSLLICRGDKKFVLLSFFSLIKMIYLRVSTKPLPSDAKSPLPVDVRRSKTLLLNVKTLPIINPGLIQLPKGFLEGLQPY